MLFQQPVASTSQVEDSPSRQDGISPELERDLRSCPRLWSVWYYRALICHATVGALCIQQAGYLMELLVFT